METRASRHPGCKTVTGVLGRARGSARSQGQTGRETGIEIECAGRAIALCVVPLNPACLAAEVKRVRSECFRDAARQVIRVIRIQNDRDRVEVVHTGHVRLGQFSELDLALVCCPAWRNLAQVVVAAGNGIGPIDET
jgi:hypothetical protein